MMDNIDLSNPVLAVAMLTQKIAELEKLGAEKKAEFSECLQKRGGLLMAMGDKQGAESEYNRAAEPRESGRADRRI